jgi:hypothetical protein
MLPVLLKKLHGNGALKGIYDFWYHRPKREDTLVPQLLWQRENRLYREIYALV